MTQSILGKRNIIDLQMKNKQIIRQKAVVNTHQCDIDLSLIPFDGELILEHEGKDYLKIVSKAGVCKVEFQHPQNLYFTNSYEGDDLQVTSTSNVFFPHTQQLKSLKVEASSVKFENSVKCEELKITATEMVSIKNDVYVTSDLDINAPIVKNTGNIKTAEKSHAKITARKMFYVDPKSSVVFRGELNLDSAHCQIKGKCGVLGASHIRANRLDTENLFKMKNIKSMEVAQWNQYPGSRSKIDTGNITVTDTTHVAAGAEMVMKEGEFNSYQIQNSGKIDCKSTHIECDNFLQKNGESHLHEDAVLDFKQFQIEGGDLSVNNAKFHTNEWVQKAGKVQVEFSNVEIKNTLQIDKAGTADFKGTKLSAKKTVGFGTLHLNRTTATVENWYHEGVAKLKNSDCTATVSMNMSHDISVAQTKINTPTLHLSGNLAISQSKFESKKCTLIPDSFTLDSTLLKSDTLEIYKKNHSQNTIAANQVEINTGNLLLNADLTLKKSKLITRSLSKDKKSSQGIFGNLTLEDSLLQTDKEVQIFSSTGAQIKVKNSEMHAGEIYSWGGLELHDSAVESNSLHQRENELLARKSHIKTNHLSVRDSMSADESRFDTDTIGFSGHTDLRSSAINATGDAFIYHDAQVKTNTTTIQSKNMNLQGTFKPTTSSLHVKEEMSVGLEGHFNQNHATAQVGSLKVHGKLSEKNSAIAAENNISMSYTSTSEIDGGMISSKNNIDVHGKMDLTGQGLKLKANKHVFTGETAQILGSQLEVDSIIWTHKGNVTVDHLNAKGKRFYNLAGSIEAKNAKFGYDHFWLNLFGNVNADHLTVHSNMLNVGYAQATNMQVSGFVNANFGLIAAKNYQESGLVSLNAGGIIGSNVHRSALLSANFGGILAIPTLPSTPGELFTWNNLSRVINIGAGVYIPQVAGLVNFGTHAVNALINLPQTVKTVKDIGSKIAHAGDMNLHELMPLINQTKDLAMSAAQFTSLGAGAWKNYTALNKEPPAAKNPTETTEKSDTSPDATKTSTPENNTNLQDEMFIDQVFTNVGNLFGGNVIDESVLGYNAGGVYAKNYMGYGYNYYNDGDVYAWDSLAVNSRNIDNTGDMYGGSHAVFTADNMTNSGHVTADESLKMDIKHNLDNTESGDIHSKGKTEIDTTAFNQNGNAVLHNGKVKADTMNLGGTSHNDYADLHIKGTSLQMGEGHNIHTHNVMIEESKVTRGAGDWQVDGWAQVNTKDYQSSQGATITVAPKVVSSSKNDQMPQENTPQTDTDTPKTKKPPENIFALQAETGQVSDKINGGEAAVLNIDEVTFKNAELNGNVFAQGKSAKIEAGDQLKANSAHLDYSEKFDQQGDFSLRDGSLKTAELILGGKSRNDLSHSDIDATKINMKNGHQVNTDSVNIASSQIDRSKGDWHNQGHTYVSTDQYTSKSGATITNQQSENEKEQPAAENSTTDNQANNPSDKKPEEPVNQFYLSAKNGTVGDTVVAGDRAVLDIKSVEYDNAKLKGNVHSYGDTATIANGKSLERDGGYSDYQQFTNHGHLGSSNHYQQGTTFVNNGSMDAKNDTYNVKDKITLKKEVKIEDTAFISNTIVDESNLVHTGQAIFEAKNYQHSGMISTQDGKDKKNVLFVTAEQATLTGKADFNHAVYKVDHLRNASDFATGNGQYRNYQTKDSFELATKDRIDINQSVRDCDLHLTGSEINVNKAIKMDHDVSLTSTQNDITISQDIATKNFYADSARDVKNNSDVQAKDTLHVQAKRDLHNYGGRFSGRKTSIRAGKILNIHKNSAKAAQFKGQKMGNLGIIEGKEEALLESTGGNIENHGGVIQSNGYTQLNSAKDVLNICNEKSYQGKYDTEKSYHAAEIRGGAGTAETGGVGLHIEAAGKVHNDGSNFISDGDNYISGKKGVDFTERHHTFVDHRSTDRKWYGKKVKRESTATVAQQSNTVAGGRNIIYSEEGNINGKAANFIAQNGTDVFADKEGINLSSLVTEDRSYKKTNHLWGVTKHSHKEKHQHATPTVFAGSGKTRLHAKKDLNCKGVVFIGDSNVHLKGKNVRLSRDVLNHSVEDKKRGFSVGAFGMNAVSTMKNKGNAWNAIAAEDPTLGKASALLQSQTVGQGLANGWNAGVSAFNATNSIASGINNGNLGSEALQRFGLGGLNGFDPTVNINLHETHMKAKFQTTGPGELNGKNVTIEADDKIILENGYQVRASENVDLKADKIEAHAAKLQSSMDRRETTYSVSGNAGTGVTNVGVKRTNDEMHATTHENVGISAGKTMTINAHQVTGNGLNLNAQNYAGNVDQLSLKTMQDTHSYSSKSIGVNSNGMVSVSNSHERGKVTHQQSGLHASGDLENQNFHIGRAHLDGAGITADGKNNLKIDQVTAVTQRDELKQSGFSITGNVNDVNRLLSNPPPVTNNEPSLSKPAIDTVNVSVQRRHQIVERDATIYGAQGTNIEIKNKTGVVNTHSANNMRVIKNENTAISLDVPVTTTNRLDIASKNITHAWNTVCAKPKPEVHSVQMIPKPEIVPTTQVKEDLGKNQAIEEKTSETEEVNNKHSELERNQPMVDSLAATVQPSINVQNLPEITDAELSTLPVVDPKTLSPGVITTVKACKQGVGEGAAIFIKVATNDGKESVLPVKLTAYKFQLLCNFGFHLALQDGDVTEAAADTAADFIISKGIEKLATTFGCGAAVGPIGWTLFACDIMNELVVKHHDIPKIAEQSMDHSVSAMDNIKKGNYFAYQYDREMADAYRQQWLSFYATNKIAACSDWLSRFVTFRDTDKTNTNNQQQPTIKNKLK